MIKDDLYIPSHRSFQHNIDYMTGQIEIDQLHRCWKDNKNSNDDISLIIPSTISKRLENICWRRMYKSIRNLPSVDPLLINWHKEEDITWLYGPNYSFDQISNDEIDDDEYSSDESNLSLDDEPYSSLDDDLPSSLKILPKHTIPPKITSKKLSKLPKLPNKREKKVRFNYIISSREIINGIHFDYDFLDKSCL